MMKSNLLLFAVFTVAVAGCSERTYHPKKFHLPRAGEATGCDLKIGDPFPHFESVGLDGNSILFDESILGERYTLVIFWSTWCGYCMTDLPHEIELSRKYKNDGLRVIGINADSTIEIGQNAAETHDVPWLNLYEGKERQISKQLGVSSWPTLFLLDSTGFVVSSTKQLRRHGIMYVNEQGDTRTVHQLDFTLINLLRASDGQTLFP